MILTRQILIQMAIFALIATTALAIMVFGYMRLPALMGVGEYRVTLELPETGGLYTRSNVTYRGVEVGIVDSVKLTDTGVAAVLSLKSDTKIPADVDAQVHSVSSVGEQYVQLIPRSGTGPMLKDGDVIPRDRATVPTDINTVLDMTNRGLEAIPRDNLKTVVDEAYIAVGGLGPELRRLVTGGIDIGDRRQEESGLADHPYRPVEAGARHADRHGGLDKGMGGEPGEHHRAVAEPGSGRGGDTEQGPGGRRRGTRLV